MARKRRAAGKVVGLVLRLTGREGLCWIHVVHVLYFQEAPADDSVATRLWTSEYSSYFELHEPPDEIAELMTQAWKGTGAGGGARKSSATCQVSAPSSGRTAR